MINATLVTIHGFWSSPASWDRLIAIWSADPELDGLRIHPFGYPSPKKPRFSLSRTRIPGYDDIAQTLATEYTVRLAGASGIAIVTHSQGGLILQRFLAWMVNEGRGRELARIRTIVMLACPNGGAEYLRSLRHLLGFGRHPQAGNLEVLNRQVTDTQRTVLDRIVNATDVDDHQCRIPFHVYAGSSDNLVPAASAQAAFRGASTLAGNHSSILDPAAPGNRTAETVKYHLLGDLAASPAQPDRRISSDSDAQSESATPVAAEAGGVPRGDVTPVLSSALRSTRLPLVVTPEQHEARLRLRVINQGDDGQFSAEVIGIVDNKGNKGEVPQNWPIPWANHEGTSTRIPSYSKACLDFAEYKWANIDLTNIEILKWALGRRPATSVSPAIGKYDIEFSSLPDSIGVNFAREVITTRLLFTVTIRINLQDPPGQADWRIAVGVDGRKAICDIAAISVL